ncbi:uncharacterized protein LOC110026342 isoform X2 [Phalaenopsis equestris]|uniref:uncharacterized protein LOC110026342 isoform X2 n=1 Tax=Phalaenopsis equestris TaxID=78828 RepID=UPI0009E5762D|nr:uncharacterized protein LOC110026342 isoform X2 [Phalaenopsis equestris]
MPREAGRERVATVLRSGVRERDQEVWIGLQRLTALQGNYRAFDLFNRLSQEVVFDLNDCFLLEPSEKVVIAFYRLQED